MYDRIRTEMTAWLRAYDHLFELQERFLLSLVEKLKATAVGRERDYASIRTVADFQSRTPIQHYGDLKPFIARILGGETNVLSPLPLTHWIQTSGTTGAPKLFPYNRDFEDTLWASAWLPPYLFIYRSGPEAVKMLDGESLLVHASGDCGLVGTGATRQPLAFVSGWLAKYSTPANPFAPPPEIQSIADWDERILQTAVHYVQRNVTRLSGVSTYILMFLDQLQTAFEGHLFAAVAKHNPARAAELSQWCREDGKLDVTRIWKNLLCLNLGGVNPFPYRSWLMQMVPDGVIYQAYMGSEGLYGVQYELDDPAMVLLPSNAFYEFLDVEEYSAWQSGRSAIPTRHTVADVRTGREYVFCVSNDLGFTSYIPGDIVKIVSSAPLLFTYARRIGNEVNLAAEKISEEHIANAMMEATRENSCVYREYLCTAMMGPAPHYTVAVEFSTPPENLQQFASDVERWICRSNVMYAEVRRMKILQPLRVIRLPTGEFDRYITTQSATGEWNPGQMKLPRLTDRPEFLASFRQSGEGISGWIG